MNKRIQIEEVEPKSYEGMFALENYIKNCGIAGKMVHLIKMRASQINGCAFCIDMHSKEALKDGETARRLFLLNAWQETTLFTPEERIVLKITEEVTLIHKGGLSTETYNEAVATLGENYLAQVIMTVVAINGWNRIAVSTHKPIN